MEAERQLMVVTMTGKMAVVTVMVVIQGSKRLNAQMGQPIILVALPRAMQALRQSGEVSPAMEHIWIGTGMLSDANNFPSSQKET